MFPALHISTCILLGFHVIQQCKVVIKSKVTRILDNFFLQGGI